MNYVSPDLRVVSVENTHVLCASTEGYGVSKTSYNEDDWE